MKRKAKVERESKPTLESLRRRRIEPKHRVAPGESKIRVTLWVDADVVREFKRQAEEPGSPKYQTLMNAALRKTVFSKSITSSSLIDDDKFIAAVAKKVRAIARQKA